MQGIVPTSHFVNVTRTGFTSAFQPSTSQFACDRGSLWVIIVQSVRLALVLWITVVGAARLWLIPLIPFESLSRLLRASMTCDGFLGLGINSGLFVERWSLLCVVQLPRIRKNVMHRFDTRDDRGGRLCTPISTKDLPRTVTHPFDVSWRDGQIFGIGIMEVIGLESQFLRDEWTRYVIVVPLLSFRTLTTRACHRGLVVGLDTQGADSF
jgi:hypothetical protein